MQSMIAACWFFVGWLCAFALTEWRDGEYLKMRWSLAIALLNAAAAIGLTLTS